MAAGSVPTRNAQGGQGGQDDELQATVSQQTLSLAECEDVLREQGVLRAHGWQSIYPVSWLTGKLENQKSGSERGSDYW